MKTYITIASLLVAGTTVNAAEYVTPTDQGSAWLTTSFTGANGTNLENASATSVWTEGLSFSDVTTMISSPKLLSCLNVGSAGTDSTFISPNANVGSGTAWKQSFSYNLGTRKIALSSITINIGLYNSSGDWQPDSIGNGKLSEGAKYRAFDFAATLTDMKTDEEVGSYTATRVVVTGGAEGAKKIISIVLKGEELESLTGDVVLALSAAQNTDNGSIGCFVGIESISFNSFSPIPEPSAFGLLAGIGALALVASRRRRK